MLARGVLTVLGLAWLGAGPEVASGWWELRLSPAECRGERCPPAAPDGAARWRLVGTFGSRELCERARWLRIVDTLVDLEAHRAAFEAARTPPSDWRLELEPLFPALALEWASSRGDRSFWARWRLRASGQERDQVLRATRQVFQVVSWEPSWRAEQEALIADSWQAYHSRCTPGDARPP